MEAGGLSDNNFYLDVYKCEAVRKFESIIAACKLPITFTHSGKKLEIVFLFVWEVCEAGVSVEGGCGVGGRVRLWRAGLCWVKWGRAGWQLFPHLQVQRYPTWPEGIDEWY